MTPDMTMETVNLGGFDENDGRAPQSLRLPTLTFLKGLARTKDALDTVVVVRKGIPVVGDKGSGKSYALRRALRAFRRAELRRLTLDYKYKPRRVVAVRTIRAKLYREALLVIGQAVTGARPAERLYGRRQTDDELCNEVIAQCMNQRVVAIVVRESEFLSRAAFAALRDLMAGTEDDAHDEGSDAVDGDAGETLAGVGVLLLGAPQLRGMVSKNSENGRRWLSPVTIPLVTADETARVYTEWFPAIGEHASHLGTEKWAALIKEHVTLGHAMTIGQLATHAQLYFRRMVRKASTAEYRRETVPFNLEQFKLAFVEAKGLDGRGEGRSDAA
jgi:type II secretory pathway predicted ATPase ExeA